jgi:hypothetical protein
MAYSSTRQDFLTGARPVRSHRRKSTQARRAFPELAPADSGTRAATGHLARIRDEVLAQAREIRADPAADNALSRLSVYTLCAFLLILAFPVGFAMLIYNLLAGENLRITLHVVALSGLVVLLWGTESAAARVLGLG